MKFIKQMWSCFDLELHKSNMSILYDMKNIANLMHPTMRMYVYVRWGGEHHPISHRIPYRALRSRIISSLPLGISSTAPPSPTCKVGRACTSRSHSGLSPSRYLHLQYAFSSSGNILEDGVVGIILVIDFECVCDDDDKL